MGIISPRVSVEFCQICYSHRFFTIFEQKLKKNDSNICILYHSFASSATCTSSARWVTNPTRTSASVLLRREMELRSVWSCYGVEVTVLLANNGKQLVNTGGHIFPTRHHQTHSLVIVYADNPSKENKFPFFVHLFLLTMILHYNLNMMSETLFDVNQELVAEKTNFSSKDRVSQLKQYLPLMVQHCGILAASMLFLNMMSPAEKSQL